MTEERPRMLWCRLPACLRTLWGETTRSGCAATGAATKLGEFEEDVNATTSLHGATLLENKKVHQTF
eukprot:4957686-Amphidinium_carterae.1